MAPVYSVPVSQSLPQNSVLLVLDGTEEQVRCNYTDCQEAYLNWNTKHATHKVKFSHSSGEVFKVFTTPLKSTFYYAMTYQGRYLVFVIEARNGWLHGYYGINGMYEFKSLTQKKPYMNDPRCTRLTFEGNHLQISGGSTGKTRIGLHALRDAFHAIWKYNGSEKFPDEFKTAFGVIVVHICESMKLCPVFKRIRDAFTDPIVRKLGTDGTDFIQRLITSWNFLSGEAMCAIDDTGHQIGNSRNVPNISSVQDILKNLAVLHVDGHFGGTFKHDQATGIRHWEPLERGNGVPSFDDILEKHIDDDGGESDGDQQNGQSGGKQKREGDEKGRHHGKSKGKREGANRGKGQQGGGGGGGRQRGGVTLSAVGFPLIGGWGGGQGKELSMDQNPIGWLMQPKDPVCMYMTTCKPPGMSIMEESKYPWCQLIKNCSNKPFILQDKSPTTRSWNCGYESMTRGGDRLSRTEALNWICTALLGLEECYLIEWG